MKVKTLLAVLLLSTAACGQSLPRPKVFDRDYYVAQLYESAALTMDGYTTVDGWSHGCYEGNSPSNSRNKVIAQLLIEKTIESVSDAYIKRGSQNSDVKWVWRLGSGIITALHFGAAAHNIAIHCA